MDLSAVTWRADQLRDEMRAKQEKLLHDIAELPGRMRCIESCTDGEGKESKCMGALQGMWV